MTAHLLTLSDEYYLVSADHFDKRFSYALQCF